MNSSIYWKDLTYFSGISAEKFNTKDELDNYVDKNKAFLNLGQLFIAENNVYVWDGEKIIQSSGEEVDLTNYVTKSGTETLTNKTLISPDIAEIKNGNYSLVVPVKSGTVALNADVIAAKYSAGEALEVAEEAYEKANETYELVEEITEDMVTKTDEQTLQNKTLVNPVITGGFKRYNTVGMYTLPNSTTNAEHELITADLEQTLTNKKYDVSTGRVLCSATNSSDSEGNTIKYATINFNFKSNDNLEVRYAHIPTTDGYHNYLVSLNGIQRLSNKTLLASTTVYSFQTKDNDKTYTVTFPKKTGTIALLSDVVAAQTAGQVDLSPYATHTELENYLSKSGNETITNKTIDSDNVVVACNRAYSNVSGLSYFVTNFAFNEDGVNHIVNIPYTTNLQTNVVDTRATQTLTNKTLSSPIITTIKNVDATINLPTTSGTLALTSDIPSLSDYVTKTGTQTLTNKTLTSPIISSIKNNSATLTLPTTSGTLALTSDIPTVPNIDMSSYTTDFMKTLINMIYPVGSVIFSVDMDNASPGKNFSWQHWENLVTQNDYLIMTTTFKSQILQTGSTVDTTGGSGNYVKILAYRRTA